MTPWVLEPERAAEATSLSRPRPGDSCWLWERAGPTLGQPVPSRLGSAEQLSAEEVRACPLLH